MYKLLALGTLIGLGVGLVKFMKKKKTEPEQTQTTQEMAPAQ